MKIALILLGGGLGSLARYSASGLLQHRFEGTFPLGTLVVNLVGSFLIGLLWGMAEGLSLNSSARTFLFVGVLGGFTTFSAYSLETLTLLRDGENRLALLNLMLNNGLGLLLAFAGLVLSRYLIR